MPQPKNRPYANPPSSLLGAKFAFDIYDFEGKSRMDMFYLGDCLRGLNLNPTLKMIDKLGGAKKKGEKFIKLEEVSPFWLDLAFHELLYIDLQT